MKKNEKHVTEQIRQPEEKKKGKKGGAAKWVALGIVLLILVATAALGLSYENETGLFSQKLETSFFHLYSPKVPTGKTIRLVTLSDLHNKEFGADNIELVKRVQKLEPDLILIAGDMVNKNEDRTDVAVTLCRQLVEIAPVYYGIGNHEGNMMYVNGLRVDGLLREVGAKVLINQSEDIVVQDTAVSVGSVSTSVLDYDEYSAPFVAEFEQKDTLKILIAHCPDLFYEKMADVNVDPAGRRRAVRHRAWVSAQILRRHVHPDRRPSVCDARAGQQPQLPAHQQPAGNRGDRYQRAQRRHNQRERIKSLRETVQGGTAK